MGARKIEIRAGTLADADLLARIGTQSFRDAYAAHSKLTDLETHLKRRFSIVAVRADIETGDCRFLLAEVDGMAGGMAKFHPAPCPVAGGDDNAFELQQLYVLESVQGHGLGRRLISRLAEIARAAGAAGIWLSAWEHADWATGFYRKVGFTEIGKVEFMLGDTPYTDLLLWMPLDT